MSTEAAKSDETKKPTKSKGKVRITTITEDVPIRSVSNIAKVEPKKRDVFVLAVLEEFSIPEVAEVLAIPVNTAYTRLRLVRAEFREALQRQGRRR